MQQVIKLADSNWNKRLGMNEKVIINYLCTDPITLLKVIDMLKYPNLLKYKHNNKVYTGIEVINVLKR
ncbi:hypothetical protein [Apilactobacillus micheneri]|uniref:hypothetical protein n=1 Tax=Apilactobacillus micheneri TaxID=1899430 RepID=UPI000D03156D|nr:hypothetical protein [Apilactobacillus micheneri]TPR37675.1 hypothetical protein DY116_00165 [Apilactobacillus micheneri]